MMLNRGGKCLAAYYGWPSQAAGPVKLLTKERPYLPQQNGRHLPQIRRYFLALVE